MTQEEIARELRQLEATDRECMRLYNECYRKRHAREMRHALNALMKKIHVRQRTLRA
jgi:hypothetical protein